MPTHKALSTDLVSNGEQNKSNDWNIFSELFLIFPLLVLFTFCFFDTFLWLHYKYSFKDSYYSHGYLVPFVSGYLVYLKRDHLKRQTLQPKNIGLIIICLSLLSHLVAVAADINFVSAFAMWIYIFGCVIYLWGYQVTRSIIFALVFLFFMLPLPSDLLNWFGLPSKKISTAIGLKIISFLDIPFFQEGFRIMLRNAELVVGTPCNGMRSMIAFTALGTLSLYFSANSYRGWIPTLVLIYPLAVLLNGIRVSALVLITEKYGIQYASPNSFWHNATGVMVFIIGMLIMFGLIRMTRGKKR